MGLFGGRKKQLPAAADDDDVHALSAAEAAAPVAAATTREHPVSAAATKAAPSPSVARNDTDKVAAALERDASPCPRRASSIFVLGDEWRAKTEQQLALDPQPLAPGRRRTLLFACLCILGNEFCERLAYYSAQTNMVGERA